MSSKRNQDRRGGVKSATNFEFPTNVKQVGTLGKGVKIYFEDYAYTYLYKLCAKKDNAEQAAFLVGFKKEELGEKIVVITGVVQSPESEPVKNGQVFSKADWDYVNKQIDTHFNGLEVVGWSRMQPGYGLYLSAADISSHFVDFKENESIVFICDPEEKVDCFYEWNERGNDIDEVPGYFIYYDKNQPMNNYMAEVKKLNEVPSKLMKEDAATSTKEVETKALKPEDIKTKESIRRIAELNRHKRMLKIMTSISAVLLFACTLMAFGLFQGNEKIAAIEQQLAEVRLGYNNIISKINDGAFPTFAATDSAVTNKINQTLASKTPTTSAADAQSSLDNGLNVLKTNSKTSAKQDNKATQTFAVVPVNNNSKQLQQSKPQQTQSQQQNKTVQPAQPATPTAPTAPATPNVPTTQVTQTTQATPVTQAAPAPQLTQAAPQNSAEVQEPKETQAKQNYDVTASGTPNKSHKVAKGDTLSSISIKYYGDISMIKRVMQANNLNDPTRLKIGSVLVIPEK